MLYAGCMFCVCFFSCCNGSLNNEITLTMQKTDIIQATTSPLRADKKVLREKLQQTSEGEKRQGLSFFNFLFPAFLKLKCCCGSLIETESETGLA